MEHLLAEEGEQDLGGASAHGPADGDHGDPHDERHTAQVSETFAVFMPGGERSGAGRSTGAEAAGHRDLPDGPGGEGERKRIDDEGPVIAERGGAETGQQGTGREGGPLGGLEVSELAA